MCGRCAPSGGGIRPIFAQQSIRENARTGRSPRAVIDDAVWGAFEAGWTEGFGADADHLKTPADVESCAEAGFTFFTIDPGEHVDGRADTATAAEHPGRRGRLPWAELQTDMASMLDRFAGLAVDLDSSRVTLDENQVRRAAVKYGRAIAHIVRMFRCVEAAMTGRAVRARSVGGRDRHPDLTRRAHRDRERAAGGLACGG